MLKRYEGLFILDTAGKEDTVKDILDRVTQEITNVGGRVETVQKMDKRPFARVANKRHTSGFYANIIFHIAPSALETLRKRFALNPDVFRMMFTASPPPKPKPAAAAA